MKPLLTTMLCMFAVLCLAGISEAQVACFTYPGGTVSCNTPNGITRQQDLGSGAGVFYDERGNMTPYNVMPAPSARPPQAAPSRPYLHESQRPSNYFSPPTLEPIQPLDQPLFMPGLGGEAGQ